jgi:ribosomal protein S19
MMGVFQFHSIMARSIWKGPYFAAVISRSSTILPQHVNKSFPIHSGKEMKRVSVTNLMVGKKFGEFVHTRKPFTYRKKDTK